MEHMFKLNRAHDPARPIRSLGKAASLRPSKHVLSMVPSQYPSRGNAVTGEGEKVHLQLEVELGKGVRFWSFWDLV